MREIKFRGLDKNGIWHHGNLIVRDVTDYSIASNNTEHLVISETVGQLTGLKDKNETEIFEGDILRLKNTKGQIVNHQEVYWVEETASFGWRAANDDSWPDGFTGFYDEYEVIGNVCENSELLK